MEFAFIVYLAGTVFPFISQVGAILFTAICIVCVGFFIGAPSLIDRSFNEVTVPIKKNALRFFKWAIPIAFICGLAPSQEVSYTMIAAYTAQSIGENEKVQNIAGESLEVIEAFLAKTKKELEKDTQESEK